jgi:hypothetical protein
MNNRVRSDDYFEEKKTKTQCIDREKKSMERKGMLCILVSHLSSSDRFNPSRDRVLRLMSIMKPSLVVQSKQFALYDTPSLPLDPGCVLCGRFS